VGNQRKRATETKQAAGMRKTALFGTCVAWKITVKRLSVLHRAPIWLFTGEIRKAAWTPRHFWYFSWVGSEIKKAFEINAF